MYYVTCNQLQVILIMHPNVLQGKGKANETWKCIWGTHYNNDNTYNAIDDFFFYPYIYMFPMQIGAEFANDNFKLE